MEDIFEIFGGKPLRGSVRVGGAKNAALPMMICSLLTTQPCKLRNVPHLLDVDILMKLLGQLGGESRFSQPGVLDIVIPSLRSYEASYSLVKSLRASFWVLAPLLARGGSARVAMPGGDLIGARPVDIHLEALQEMGAEIRLRNGVVIAEAPSRLKGAELTFRFPSVGATHQILMAAAATDGKTVIRNAAREPEVIAVGTLLSQMGAEIEGLGTSEILIRGNDALKGFDSAVIGDRIEAASYLLAAVAATGSVSVAGISQDYFGEFSTILEHLGADVSWKRSADPVLADTVSLTMSGRPAPVKVLTGPFPLFATDIQAPLLAALTLCKGESSISETVYEGRFGHVSELSRLGAKISLAGSVATIQGVSHLTGAVVEARDIRAGAAMVVAGLAAKGRTVIEEGQHLRRGYDDLERKIRELGGRIVSSSEEMEELSLIGC
ncbi:UDP-N-acetylglucosamine 1-carboxyvinyltransferase [bacterium]|jgi:UDP-N-acetylglucosamine 1-carboxyvinyltransferase|nr:UDP-N-acetylglucosamine 1-carboxyvinyltransferase [bacterium]